MVYKAPKRGLKRGRPSQADRLGRMYSRNRAAQTIQAAFRAHLGRRVPIAPRVPAIPPMAPRYFRGAMTARIPLRNRLRHRMRRLRTVNRGLTYWQRKSMRRLLSKPLGKYGSKYYSRGW